MIKVKGQISELAMSLVDSSEEIREMVKMFFSELSRKANNPIYNILPDTVGQLSVSDHVTQNDFEKIVKFLLSFITKDKQVESIVDKLCQRLSVSEISQRRDYTFCLAHITHTEKSIRALLNSRLALKEVISDDVGKAHLKFLVSKCRRQQTASISTEMKEAVDNLDRLLSGEGGQDMDNNLNDEQTASAESSQAAGTPRRRGSSSRSRTTARQRRGRPT
ncbi:hypothetical protein PINS_up006760 [Pythium insidiosum]|nr:hypothetical protein PINS_up006760 [Pythium insidiosum]